MPNLYFDTSALIKLYVEEVGTAEVLGLVEELRGDRIIILDITLLECRSARRREREGDISGPDANRILQQVHQDASALYLVQPSSSAVIEEASRLLDTHALRAYDALQLAGCLIVRRGVPSPPTFVCADGRLCEAAEFEGLQAINPLDAGPGR